MQLAVILFGLALACVQARTTENHQQWLEFKKDHVKFYRSLAEEYKRFSIFQDNLQKIDEHNALYEKGLKSYKLGVTPFADLTSEEFKELLAFKPRSSEREGNRIFEIPENVTIPESIDWREKGAVTPVKNQGVCGGCWAFSVTGSLEGAYFNKYNNLVSFSEQQLIDCTIGKYQLLGCNGGELDPAFQYMKDKGLETEKNYPFVMYDDKCRVNDSLIVTKISEFIDVEPNNEDALIAAVGLIGPVSIAIDAEPIQLYNEGIFESESCSKVELNHAVLAVGYGTMDGKDYWIVKNSWSTMFGEKGYIRMRRGVNQCGIATQPSYPVI
ncbi:hypothetical protein GWI33_006986 [Rhynchophorus ferrugineus]|uniref:Cathepsin L n=1 Tax=Rhynchophorus ferrugineus TaxID=354439 RepID=A0A834II40_RHYFE|nr:hypothetical protein GWI33_006986 [Rhynchophorus ferrugineus]